MKKVFNILICIFSGVVWIVALAGILVTFDPNGPVGTALAKLPPDQSSPNVTIQRGKKTLYIPRSKITSSMVQYGDVLTWADYYGKRVGLTIQCRAPIWIDPTGFDTGDWNRCYERGRCVPDGEEGMDCSRCCIGQSASYKTLNVKDRPCARIRCQHRKHKAEHPDYIKHLVWGGGSSGYCHCPKNSK